MSERGRTIEVKLAKADKDDIAQMVKFFHMLEEAIEYGTYTTSDDAEPEQVDDERLLDLIRAAWNERGPGVGTAWRRVVWGCDTLIANCCDPDSDVLEWRKDVREWLESQQTSEATND